MDVGFDKPLDIKAKGLQ